MSTVLKEHTNSCCMTRPRRSSTAPGYSSSDSRPFPSVSYSSNLARRGKYRTASSWDMELSSSTLDSSSSKGGAALIHSVYLASSESGESGFNVTDVSPGPTVSIPATVSPSSRVRIMLSAVTVPGMIGFEKLIITVWSRETFTAPAMGSVETTSGRESSSTMSPRSTGESTTLTVLVARPVPMGSSSRSVYVPSGTALNVNRPSDPVSP